jgi:site-specific recombinase XerD
MLVPAFLERYIRSLESGSGTAQTTAANYRHCAKQIARHLSLARVDEITGNTILQMQATLLEDGLCNNTVARGRRFLKQAMQYAEDSGIIDRTPFTRRVRPPKRETREQMRSMQGDRERLLLALDSMQDIEVTLVIRLGRACGLRREEMCGLRWRDIDLDTHLLRIEVAACQCEGKAVVKESKTPASRREVSLEPDLERRLAQRRR